MGAIDVVVDKALDRRVAMKTLHANLREDDNSVRMFLREARLTGLLDHPHIVPVYDIAEGVEGQLYFTMKLVEGKTLQDIIEALPQPRSRALGRRDALRPLGRRRTASATRSHLRIAKALSIAT